MTVLPNGKLNPIRRTILIDTDTASDDAVALIMALQATDVSVLAIATVAGNVGVGQASRYALNVGSCAAPGYLSTRGLPRRSADLQPGGLVSRTRWAWWS